MCIFPLILIIQGQGGKQPVTMEIPEAAGAAVGCEDIQLESRVTPASLVEIVRGVLSDSLVRNVNAVYQFELSGPSGGVFYLDLKHGESSDYSARSICHLRYFVTSIGLNLYD